MAESTWLCQVCETRCATLLCTCQETAILLCTQCQQVHFAKGTRTTHFTYPLEAYRYYKAPGYATRISEREKGYQKAKEAATRTIAHLTESQERLRTETEALIVRVQAYRDTQLDNLEQWKEYMKYAIEEAGKLIYPNSPEYSCDLVREMIEEWPGASDSFIYIAITIDFSQCYEALRGALTQTISKAVKAVKKITPSVNICAVKGKTVTVVDLQTVRKSSFEVGHVFTEGTVFALVQSNVLAAVGGYPATSDAFLINIPTHQLAQVASLTSPRNVAGVISLDGALYVFGGYNGKEILTSSEKYSLSTDTWSGLPSMAFARAMFSPCEFEQRIYLIDPSQVSRKIEVFKVKTETYSVFSVELPSGRFYSVSVVVGGELVVFGTAKKVLRLRIGKEEAFRVKQFNDPGKNAATIVQPVVMNRKVFYANYEEACFLEFDLDQSTIAVSSFN